MERTAIMIFAEKLVPLPLLVRTHNNGQKNRAAESKNGKKQKSNVQQKQKAVS